MTFIPIISLHCSAKPVTTPGHELFNMTWVVMMAWSFPESEMGQIHSIQGLGHNHLLSMITSWGLGHR